MKKYLIPHLKNIKMKRVLLFILIALCANITKAQVLLDNFDYPTNTTTLNSQGWGFALGTTAASTPAVISDGAGLTYAGYSQSGIGRGVVLKSALGQSVGRYHANISNTTAGAFYMSYLLNVSAVPTSLPATNINFAGIMVGSASNPGFTARSYMRSISGSSTTYNLGVAKVTTPTYFSTPLNINTTYLVVVKYTVNTGATTNDVVDMWINPAISATEPAATIPNLSAGNDVTLALTGPGLMQRASGPVCEVDAVRSGPFWNDVVMPPPVIPGVLTTSIVSLNFGGLVPGTTSPAQSFNLSGTNLTGFPGVINVNAPTNYEVSNDNLTWGTATTIAYSTATLAATPVYVRLTPPTIGASLGTLTLSGGGVVGPPSVALNGGGATVYYSKPAGSLHVVSNWGLATDGTGTAPVNFITDYEIFTIANRATHTLDDNFQVFGIGSKIIVGDGTNPTKLILPSGFTILNDIDHKVDISNNATLEVANKIYRSPGDLTKTPFPYFGTMAINSTVEYTWNGTDVTDTVRIPAETFGNLKLINGLKYFSSGFAFANGTLDITNVTGVNGTGNGSASILVRGNITMNSSFFDVGTVADANRMNLNLGGVGTQTITGGDFYVGQLRTQAVSPTVLAFPLDIVLGLNTNIITGTTTAGGFNLQQAAHNLSLNGNTLTMGSGSSFLSTNLGTISGTSTSNLLINKTTGTAAIGNISFKAGGQMLNDLTYNSAGTGTNNLTLNSPLSVNGILNLINGKILVGNNTVTAAGTISGGSSASYIVTNGTGALKINAVGATTKTFPVGPSATLYHPATLNNSGTSDNFSVNVSSVAPPCGNPTLSVPVRWNITEETIGGSNCTITLDYNGVTPPVTYSAATAKIVDCNGSGPTYFGNGSVTGTIATGTGFTSFSPFGITSDLAILPVTFVNFSGIHNGNSNKLTWITSTEQNNLGFEVERSIDGQNFSNLGFVNTLAIGGNSTTNLTYNFTDNKINTASVLYYRLRQLDINNQSNYSDIVKLKGEKVSGLTIDGIAPNPVQNSLVASISSPSKNIVRVQVLDIAGRVLQTQQVKILEGNNVFSVNVSLLSKGIYLLKVIDENNSLIQALKFLKQ
jgi:hypothetical protein